MLITNESRQEGQAQSPLPHHPWLKNSPAKNIGSGRQKRRDTDKNTQRQFNVTDTVNLSHCVFKDMNKTPT